MLECVSPCADEMKQLHGNFLRARPGTLSHKSAIIDSLFLGLCFKKKNY